MSFALEDEPERGRRWVVLGVGVVLASGLWGGGLVAANRYTPTERVKRPPAVMTFIKLPPPPPKIETSPAPAKVEPPKPTVEIPKPKVEPPKPKKRRRRERPKKVRPRSEIKRTVQQEPSTPKSAPPSRAPVQIGLSFTSTSSRGRGPAVQVGNHFGGQEGGRAKAPETRAAPGGTQFKPGPPKTVKPVRVNAKVRKKVSPKYTKAALRGGIEGKVVIVVTIAPTGKVIKAVLIKGLGFGLDEVALRSVKRWIFSPATLDGHPIRSTKRLTVDFVLEG